jgi:Bacterial PH domain
VGVGFFSATEISIETVQTDYARILLDDEKVLAAFKTIRDTAFLTNYRFVIVNVQGITGKKIDIQSVPYRSIVRFSLETAGTFDLDADLKIWVSSAAAPIEVKIGPKSDMTGIQQILAQHIFGK